MFLIRLQERLIALLEGGANFTRNAMNVSPERIREALGDQKVHIGLIADGNRRWAKLRGKGTSFGHRAGLIKALQGQFLPALQEIPQVTAASIYLFSTENWNRSKQEKDCLWELFVEFAEEYKNSKEIRFRHIGRADRLPQSVLAGLQEMEKKTSKNKGLTVNLCIDYSSDWEVNNAIDLANEDGGAWKDYALIPPFDIIIRTGGERRLSNFGMRAGVDAYAEYFFVKPFLPALTGNNVRRILWEYAKRDRRKGR